MARVAMAEWSVKPAPTVRAERARGQREFMCDPAASTKLLGQLASGVASAPRVSHVAQALGALTQPRSPGWIGTVNKRGKRTMAKLDATANVAGWKLPPTKRAPSANGDDGREEPARTVN